MSQTPADYVTPNESAAYQRLLEKLKRELGDVVLAALADPQTVEVMLNPDGALWHEKLGEPMARLGSMRPAHAEALIRTLASHHDKSATGESPLLECELPLDGSRFAGLLPPVVSAPSFAIRRPASSVFTLAQYREAGILSRAHEHTLIECVRDKRNILIVGGTGSGKTTLANALIAAIVECDPHARLAIIEDTRELQSTATNAVQMHTSEAASMTQLLRVSLRLRPDRIIVGETRGPESLDLLQAWNTGHPGGLSTIHANSALAGLTRLTSLVSQNPHAPRQIEPLVGEAVNLLVFIERTANGRRVRAVEHVAGFHEGRFLTTSI